MKKTTVSLLTLATSLTFTYGAFSLSGTALINPEGVTSGDVAIYLVSTDGSSFTTALTSINAEATLTDSATYGSSFSTFTSSTSATASFFIGNTSVGSGAITDLTGGISTGHLFGIIVFENSTTTTLESDTYRIFTDSSWLVGTDGTFNFGGGADYPALSSASPVYTGSIPEPSTYAALSGLLALSWVMLRRRRA